MTRRIAFVTALAVTALLVPAALARADSITLSAAADRVEEVDFAVIASGQGGEDRRVYATIKPVGLAGCGSTYRTDADGDNVIFFENAEGSYSVGGTADVDEPGAYLLCAWLQEFSSSSAAYARTSMVVNVRSAVASLKIRGKRRIRRGRTRAFVFSGAAELDRSVYAKVKRVGRRGCGDAYETDSGDSYVFWERVQGFFRFREAPSKYHLDRRGRYLICAWVQESSSDLEPEAAASFKFRVGKKRRRR